MSRFVFAGTAAAAGLLAVVVIGPYIHDRPADPRPWSAAQASPSPTLAEPPAEPSEGGGVPTGVVVGGVLLALALGGVGLVRRRRGDEPLAEVQLQEHWYCVLYARTDGTEREVNRGMVSWPALSAREAAREVVRRHAERHGRPEGTAYRCEATAASRWVIFAGARPVDSGATALVDGATADGRAVELLDVYASERNLSASELRGLRCVVYGPDGLGEADGRDW